MGAKTPISDTITTPTFPILYKGALQIVLSPQALLGGFCVSAALQSDAIVTVTEQDGSWVFPPNEPVAGLIFYLGGKVENTAYAPLLYDLAADGILCVLVKIPCNLAVLDMNAADALHGIIGFHKAREGYLLNFPEGDNTQAQIHDFKARLKDLENNIWIQCDFLQHCRNGQGQPFEAV